MSEKSELQDAARTNARPDVQSEAQVDARNDARADASRDARTDGRGGAAARTPVRAIKGTRDLLPEEAGWFTLAERVARRWFAAYGFGEIRTPIFEATELFRRSVGDETDIVSKEMYTFEDRDGGSLTLRPEATAQVARAYVEHRLWLRPGLQRLYYIGPMFRRERPQKGRYRQFYQIGAEVFGPAAPQIDYELLEMLTELLAGMGIGGARLVINSVGCPLCRPRYNQLLRERLAPVAATLCGDCQRRAERNPLRVFDCKVAADQATIAALPTIAEVLCEECRAYQAELERLLTAGDIAYERDPRLVRGLDYYTRTAFEYQHGALGAQNALLGGGRYDGLTRELGAPAEAGGGIGFAIGEDRLVLALEALAAEGAGPRPAAGLAAVVIPMSQAEQVAALALARTLRRALAAAAQATDQAAGGVEVAIAGRKLGKQLELAAKQGARAAILVGEREVAAGRYPLKDLARGEQQEVAAAELAQELLALVAPPAGEASR